MMSVDRDAFLAGLDADVAAIVAAGMARAAQRPNNMARVAAALPLPRQALFHVTYAAMRAIDDFVDETFMARSPAERAATRPAAHAVVGRWQAQAEAAAAGRFVATPDALFPELFAVLNRVVGASAIGAEPWRALAGAMHADLDEGCFSDWADFDAYAEGAAVAPASIFIYLLAATIDDDLSSRLSLDRSPADYARDLAVFCYLVHILRDLAVDAGRADRLVTLPDEVLAACRLDRPALARAVAGDPTVDLAPLVAAVAERAAPRRQAAGEALAALRPQLGAVERNVIDALFALYDRQLAAILANPSGIVDGSVTLGEAAIAAILARLDEAA